MAELWGGIERAIGAVLDGIYSVIPSYGVAIVLLTVGVRALMIPLTIKQVRGFQLQQKLQPRLKEIQQKHKGDRTKQQEEISRLYKEHGASPLSGCGPMLAQAPVFIALYSVLRASILAVPQAVALSGGAPVPPNFYSADVAKGTFCVPTALPQATGPSPAEIECRTEKGQVQRFRVGEFLGRTAEAIPDAGWVAVCQPFNAGGKIGFNCGSRFGTGHLPKGGDLFADITRDRGSFLGLRLGCTVTQIGSKTAARACTDERNAGGARAAPYYVLIALFIFSTYYQARQMAMRAKGPAAQQQKMMMRIMPIFLGFISLNIPAGVNVYWFTSNLWTIVQQEVIFRAQERQEQAGGRTPEKPRKGPPETAPEPTRPPAPNPGGPKRKRRKRKRR